MRDYDAFRKTAIRYWERRRIFYNLALIFPALFGYCIFRRSLSGCWRPAASWYRSGGRVVSSLRHWRKRVLFVWVCA